VFYYLPGERHFIEPGREMLDYCWLTLDGPGHISMLKSFALSRPQHAGPCPEELFDELPACLLDVSAEGERRASLLAYQILMRAAQTGGERAPAGNLSQSTQLATAWMQKNFHDSRLNVTGLAQRFRLPRSTFYRLFVSRQGVSPVQYLGRLRIKHALDLLTHTRLSVAEVAARSGLPDLAYFSRLIRRNTGYSPRSYRLLHNRAQPQSPEVQLENNRRNG